ncbi:TetR/AcrR family fatty acid metabolism transcriptional regulator [Paenibacillus sp. 4624]|uniref:TetR/AcrR family transcriptional regulator n=1 Tax=Paenibacillus amylolyticus TaxID=1451 RepID=A0A5M9WPW9_PAEAM|nr:TetR/AcrR family transcriptional regulator [Paenibacillus amylolyticus]KAA8783660.1 TetR/AcrR family transcriptional regulator [Paenibacillus amylolyticus]
MARYKKTEEKKSHLLYAAFQALSDLGYDAVTLQIISDYAKVSKGVAHYYFENKEAIFIELLTWLTDKIFKKESSSIALEEKAIPKLQSYIRSVFISPEENRKFYRVYLDFLAKASRNSVYREINQRFYDNCSQIGSEIITIGQKEGVFNPHLSPKEASREIRAIIDGYLIQWLMMDEDQLHDIYHEGCLASILKILK